MTRHSFRPATYRKIEDRDLSSGPALDTDRSLYIALLAAQSKIAGGREYDMPDMVQRGIDQFTAVCAEMRLLDPAECTHLAGRIFEAMGEGMAEKALENRRESILKALQDRPMDTERAGALIEELGELDVEMEKL